MSSPDPEIHPALRELDRVLRSELFKRSEQLSRFLAFLVQRHIEGRNSELKESVLGAEVFGRKTDYNPKVDPIVRTEARRLRARLSEYYANEGKDDALIIEIPKGGYVPAIREPQRAIRRPVRGYWVAAAMVCIVIGLGAGVLWWRAERDLRFKTTPEVYDLYLRARAFEMQPSLKGAEESIGLFEQALAKDPTFAPAHAGVAAGEAARSAFDRFDGAERAAMIARGRAAAEKAIRLDPRSADAQDAMGMMDARESHWSAAERSFRRALELAPRDPLWQTHFAMFLLLPLGRVEEAVDHLRIAEQIDPAAPQTHTALSLALRSAGRFEEADAHCQRAAVNDQERGTCWAQTLLRQGNTKQAVDIMEATWSGHLLDPGAQWLGIAYAKAGRVKDAERIAALVPRPNSKVAIFAALGDKDRTFEILDRMVPMGPTRIGRDIIISPNYAFLKGDPRMKALRGKLGLPE
jgi:tetratricopeptide (TPR) repeat protein